MKESYEGKVKNTGCQQVKAPYQSDKKDSCKINRGNDLRQRAGGKSGK